MADHWPAHRPRRWAGALAALLAAAVALTGCGGSRSSEPSIVAHEVAAPALPAHNAPARHRRPRVSATAAAVATRVASRAVLSAADRTSFARLADARGGQVGLAVAPLGRGSHIERVGSLRSAVAWSTSKVPIAMAVIAAGQEQAQMRDLTLAIDDSDNAAAMRLWAALGGGSTAAAAADAQLRAAGDAHTRIEPRPLLGPEYTPFGQTAWPLADQARFVAGMACLPTGSEVLGLMNQVTAGQRWGLGAASVDAQFKGGWGPGAAPGVTGGYLDRQMGVLTIRGKPLAVTIATRPADGSHETGTSNLTAMARWLVAHADVRGVPAQPRC